jgi:hypothetical protein
MSVPCQDEESTSDLSTPILAYPSSTNTPFQHLHVECLINSGQFGHKLKIDVTSDVEKADQHCFHLGLRYSFLDLHSMDLRFLQFKTTFHIHSLFHFSLHFHVRIKLTTRTDLTSYYSTNTERIVSKLSVWALSCCITHHSK